MDINQEHVEKSNFHPHQGFQPQNPMNPKSYQLEIDKSKVFWFFVLGILIFTFIFVFGYWIGQKNSNNYFDMNLAEKDALIPRTSTLAIPTLEPKTLPLQNPKNSLPEQGNLGVQPENTASNMSPVKEASSLPNQEIPSSEQNQANNQKLDTLEMIDQTQMPKKQEETKQNKTQALANSPQKTAPAVDPYHPRNIAIQVGIFSTSQKAEQLKNQLRKKGFFTAYTKKEGKSYKVKLGNFNNPQKANSTLKKVKEALQIKDAFITKVK